MVAEQAQAPQLVVRDPLGRDARHGGHHLLDVLGRDGRGPGVERMPPRRALLAQPRAQRQLPQTCRRGLFVDQRLDRFAPLAPCRREVGLRRPQGLRFACRLQVGVRDPALVEHVDRLVGEEAVGDVAVGERHAGLQRLLRVAHPVVPLVAGGDVAQDLERLLGRRGLDHDLLEAAFEGCVDLDVRAVFVARRGADGLQLAARQRGFEYVGRVEAALRRPRTDDRVDFVDEDDRVLRLAQLVEQLLHPLLEFAAELGARDEGRDIEREERLPGDRVGHLARGDAQGQPLDDGALAHARLADQDRVVLLAPREDLHHALDLPFAADHGVDPPFAGHAREVGAEPVEQLRGRPRFGGRRVVGVDRADADLGARVVVGDQLAELLAHHFGVDTVHFEDAGGGRRTVGDDRAQGVGRRYGPRLLRVFAKLLFEGVVERLGALLHGAFAGMRTLVGQFALQTLAHLMQFPLLEPFRENTVGQRSLLPQQLQRKEILVGAGHPRFGRVECRPGDNPFERFRNFHLHCCVVFFVSHR